MDFDDTSSKQRQRSVQMPLMTANEYSLTEVPKKTIAAFTVKTGLRHLFSKTGPFALSNFFLASLILGNGAVLNELGPKATVAGPLMSTLTYALISTLNGILCATGILIGQLCGAENIRGDKTTEISHLMKESWIITTLLGIPTVIIFFNLNKLLISLGIESSTAGVSQEYFRALSYGMLPTLWNLNDEQLALGIGKSNLTIITGITYAALAMLFGYPLALGALGLPRLGPAGLGYGSAISGVLSFIGLRVYYYFNADFKKYDLYRINITFCQLIQNMICYLKLGFPIGLQNFFEFGNLAVISIFAGRLGSKVLTAEQVSLIPMSAYTVILSAWVQTVSIVVATALGEAKTLVQALEHEQARLAYRNAYTLANLAVSVGLFCTMGVALVFITAPRQLSALFIDDSGEDSSKILQLSTNMLLANGVGLFAMTTQKIYGAALSGAKNVSFVPICNFICMSLMGLTAAGLLTLVKDKNPVWLFICRNIGMALAALAITYMWFSLPSETVLSHEANTSSVPRRRRCWQFFNEPESGSVDDSERASSVDHRALLVLSNNVEY